MFVLSSPSGAGKSTLARQLLDEDEMIQQYIDYYSEEDPPITSTSNMAPSQQASERDTS